MEYGVETMQVRAPVAGYHAEPSLDSEMETQLPFGTPVSLLEKGPFFSKVQASSYRTPGYVENDSISRDIFVTTHRVMKPVVNVYAGPSFKSRRLHLLPMNSLLSLRESTQTPEGIMLKFDGTGWIFAKQVMLDSVSGDCDFVELLLAYVNFPYTWGAVDFPDCSGMVRQALLPRLKECRRNCKDLILLGMEADTDPRTLKRGDLVFFMEGSSRHVVVMVDGKNCVHASILNGYVLVEPLVNVIRAQAKYGTGEISAVRRFPWYKR